MRKRLLLPAAALMLTLGGLTGVASAASGSASDNPQAPSVAAAVAAPEQCMHFDNNNAAGFERVSTYNDPKYYTSMAWTDVSCGHVSFMLRPGEEALVQSRVTAELNCVSSAKNGWCLGRVLVNGVEGQPSAPEPSSYAWDSTNNGQFNWSAHSLPRTNKVMCPRESRGCNYDVQLQTRNHQANTSLWLDDLSMEVSVYKGNTLTYTTKP